MARIVSISCGKWDKAWVGVIDPMLVQMSELRKRLVPLLYSYLRETCEGMGGSVSFDGVGNSFVSVSYDGGSHPDWASNAFSAVKSVFVEGDSVFLDIEDDDHYPLASVSFDELADISSFMQNVVLPEMGKERV